MIINVTNARNLNRLNSVLPKKDFFLWFYADWCGHCRSMEDEWTKLVKTYGKKYNLARVRDDQKDQLINNLGSSVQGFPTLGATNLKNSGNNSGNNSGINSDNNSDNNNTNNMFNTYQGPRTSSDFSKFIKQHLVAEKVKRAMKRRGVSPCAMKRRGVSPCAMKRRGVSPCAMKRRGVSPCAMRRKANNNSRKRIVFVKPKKGCGGKSKKFRAVNL